MKYLKLFESDSFDNVSHYLSKIGATKEDIIDIFQGMIDIGYELKFFVRFINANGDSRDAKSSSQETPILGIKINKVGSGGPYYGGNIKFNNMEYLENLYHSLSMFMSMYSNKCKLTYELDSKIELLIRCEFKTEHDDTKLLITKNDIDKIVEESKKDMNVFMLHSNMNDLYRYDTTQAVAPKSKYTKIYITSNTRQVLTRLIEIAKENDNDYIDNELELNSLRDNCLDIISKQLSKINKKEIRFLKEVNGFYSIDDNTKIISVEFENIEEIYKDFTFKKGFLRSGKASILIESLIIKLKVV